MTDPDDKILFDALRRAGISEDMAYTAVQEVRNMAGQNIDAKLEAIRAEIAAQGAKNDSTRWMLGAVLAPLATLAALGLLNTALGLTR